MSEWPNRDLPAFPFVVQDISKFQVHDCGLTKRCSSPSMATIGSPTAGSSAPPPLAAFCASSQRGTPTVWPKRTPDLSSERK